MTKIRKLLPPEHHLQQAYQLNKVFNQIIFTTQANVINLTKSQPQIC